MAAKFLSPDSVSVIEGSPVNLICESEGRQRIQACYFEVQGFSSIKLYDGVKNDRRYIFTGSLASGRCGLLLLSVNRKNAGKVICKLVLAADLSDQSAKTDILVLHPIEELAIVSNSLSGSYEYKENDPMVFSCTAKGGFPTPKLSLYIGIYMNNIYYIYI